MKSKDTSPPSVCTVKEAERLAELAFDHDASTLINKMGLNDNDIKALHNYYINREVESCSPSMSNIDRVAQDMYVTMLINDKMKRGLLYFAIIGLKYSSASSMLYGVMNKKLDLAKDINAVRITRTISSIGEDPKVMDEMLIDNIHSAMKSLGNICRQCKDSAECIEWSLHNIPTTEE